MPCNSLPKSWLAESRRRIGSYLETMTNSSYEWHLNSFVCDTNQQIGFHNKANQWCRWGTWWTGCRQPVNNHPSRCGWVGLEGEKGEGLFTYIHMATSRSTPPPAWGPSPPEPVNHSEWRSLIGYYLRCQKPSRASTSPHQSLSVDAGAGGRRRRAWSRVLPLSLLLVTRCCFSPGLHHLTSAPVLPLSLQTFILKKLPFFFFFLLSFQKLHHFFWRGIFNAHLTVELYVETVWSCSPPTLRNMNK